MLSAILQPSFKHNDMLAMFDGFDSGVLLTAMADRQYAGYIDRQRTEIRQRSEHERQTIPNEFDFAQVSGLRAEAMERLAQFRPTSLGQAGRLEGVNPTDITLLTIAMKRWKRDRLEPETV